MKELSTETKRRGKENYTKSGKLQARRNKRRNEAIDREVAYEALSVAKRLELAKSRRGESKREVARLTALLSNTKKVANAKQS